MIKSSAEKLVTSIGGRAISQLVTLAMVFIMAPLTTSAHAAHSPEDHLIPYSITYLKDDDNQLEFHDLFYSPWKHGFKNVDGQTNFGVTRASFWFKITVPAQSKAINAILEINYPKLDNVTFYTLEADRWKVAKTGDSLPFSQREIEHPKFLKPISLAKNTPQIIYFKVMSNGPINVLTKLWEPSGFHHFDSKNMALAGVLFGALFAMIAFNLFIYLSIGGRDYLYYFGYLTFITLFFLSLNGFLSAYLLPEFPAITNSATFPLIYIAMVLGLLFIAELSTTTKLSPVLFIMIKGACVGLIAIGLLGGYLGGLFFSIVTPYIGIAVILLGLYIILNGVRAGYKPSYYVGFAILPYTPTALLYALSTTGLIKQGAWTAHAFQFSVVIAALLLSFALAYRIRYTKNTLAEVRESVAQARTSFARQLIESRDEERQLLASELHDGMGQNLLAIKNKLSRALDSRNPVNKNIDDAHNIVKTTIDDVRRLSHKLHPHILDRLGLKEAVIAVVRDAFDTKKVKVKLSIDDTEVPRRSQVALHLYRIVQEGVKNILTHGRSKYVNVEMFQLANTITLRIENLPEMAPIEWMPVTDMEQGFGLSSIRERVDVLDGQCIFLRNKSGGFRMEVTVPFIQ